MSVCTCGTGPLPCPMHGAPDPCRLADDEINRLRSRLAKAERQRDGARAEADSLHALLDGARARLVAVAGERDEDRITTTDPGVEFAREDDGRWIADLPGAPGCMAYGSSRGNALFAAALVAVHAYRDVVRERDGARRKLHRLGLYAAKLRHALAEWRGEVCTLCHERKMQGLPARRAVVALSWSDRESRVCMSCLAGALVGIARDHSYDRGDMLGIIEWDSTDAAGRAAARGIEAIRAILDAECPGWRDCTLDESRHPGLPARLEAAAQAAIEGRP